MKVNRNALLLTMVLVAALLSFLPVSAEESVATGRPRIAVFGFLNLTGDSSFSIPTETATNILSFTIQLLNKYEIVEVDVFSEVLSDASLMQYSVSKGLDFILYGTLVRNTEGRLRYELSLFDRGKGKTTLRETAQGESVMDVFDIADKLSASVLESIVGRRLAFGAIQIENKGIPVQVTVLVDGASAIPGEVVINHIPEGPHKIRIVRTDDVPPGTSATLDFDVTVAEGATVSIPFAFEQPSIAGRLSEPLDMISIAGGTFDNGTDDMTVSSFMIGKYEITQRQYAEVMGRNPVASSSEFGVGNNYPVYHVSWYDAVTFCNALSLLDGYDAVYTINGTDVTADFTRNGYRLPTEAEWEYAALGGKKILSYKYAGSNAIDRVAWSYENAFFTSHPVGSKEANKYGIHDMSGNVWEWCHDWFGEYRPRRQRDYTGAPTGDCRVRRGGSFLTGAASCAVSYRLYDDPLNAYQDYGFRVVRRP